MFNIFLLKEFRGLNFNIAPSSATPAAGGKEGLTDPTAAATPVATPAPSSPTSAAAATAAANNRLTIKGFSANRNLFAMHAASNTTFSAGRELLAGKNALLDDQERSSVVAPSPGIKAPPPPHCGEPALFVVRLFGYYLQLMDLLRPHAGKIAASMAAVFDEFYRVVWTTFGKNINIYSVELLSPRARDQSRRLETLVEGPEPCILAGIDVGNESSLYGLAAGITAIESVTFLVACFRALRPRFESRLAEAARGYLNRFSSESLDSFVEIRWLLYKNLVGRILNADKILSQMNSCVYCIKRSGGFSCPADADDDNLISISQCQMGC
jgi:hypothetical protein